MTTYKRKPVKENPERQIVLGMIISDKFIRDIQPILKTELIETPFILTVLNWCQIYFNQFQKAPGIHIEDIFKKEIRLGTLEDEVEDLIEDFLASLSSEYERAESFNSAYLLDQTEKYFEGRNLTKKIENVKMALSRGDVSTAQDEFLNYDRIALPQSKGIDPFTDREGMMRAFDHSSEPIFRLPGAVGQFLNDLFVRDAFVTFLGPEKRGKTWMLIEMSMWARRCGVNVAFFAAGDMTLPQMQIRYGVRFTGRSHKPKYCGELRVPCLDCWHNQDDSCNNPERAGTFAVMKNKETGELAEYEEFPDHIPCTHCLKVKSDGYQYKGSSWFEIRPPVKPLTWNEAADTGEKLNRRWGKKAQFKLAAYSNTTFSVKEMKHQLHMWEDEEGFVPGMIVTDYMDLLVPDKESANERHSINRIWAEMRGLTQEKHCLGLSASQSDAASYYAKWIGMTNFSEDKRKFSHVTGNITLNQLPHEKRRGIMRLGQLAVREDEFDEKKYVTILQSLAMGRPILDSF